MNKTIIFCLGTILGFAVGVVSTNYYLKKEYSRIANEEIESVKEAVGFYNAKSETEPLKEVKPEPANDPTNDISAMEKEHAQYNKIIENGNYGQYFENDKPSEKIERDQVQPIQYIHPESMGANDDYESIFYVYWNDDILTEGAIRSTAEVVENVELHVGFDFKDHAGEYEEDTVYGVNHPLKEYFEIDFVDEPFSDEE